jgi:protein required for attachment to host cells
VRHPHSSSGSTGLDHSLHHAGGMNMNSLVIVADTARARLFRTAKTSDAEVGIELLEVEALDAKDAIPTSAVGDDLPRFARQIASHAAQFAHYHFCNPFIVVASPPVSMAIFGELERELPNAHVRRVTAEMGELPPRELIRELLERAAFTPLPARTPGQIEL